METLQLSDGASNPTTAAERLLPQHQKLVDDSAISPEVAAARGYRSITDPKELATLGYAEYQQRVPCLLHPVLDPRGKMVLHHIRPDDPRIDEKGKPKKYEFPAGKKMRIDIPRAVAPVLGDPNVTLMVTEGTRKTDSAVTKGIICIGIVGTWCWRGTNDAGGKVALPDWEEIALNGRKVVLAFDSDSRRKRQVYDALARLSEFLKNRGAKVSYIHLQDGPPGPDGEPTKTGLDDFFAGGGTLEMLRGLHKRGPGKRPKAAVKELEPDKEGRVEIDGSTDEDLRLQTDLCWAAIKAANDPPRFFRAGDLLVRVERDDSGALVFVNLDVDHMRNALVHVARFSRMCKEGRVPCHPSVGIVRNVLATQEPDLPRLDRIVSTSVFAPDGSLISREGYDPSGRVFLDPKGLIVRDPPERSTSDEVEAARLLLVQELLGDFPFVSPADRAAAVGLILLPFVRDMIDSPTPLHIIEKPQPGTGAGLLLDCASIIATGRRATIMTEAYSEVEMGKKITAALIESPSHIVLDNLRRRLDSGQLSAVLTGTRWKDRILGLSRMVNLPIRCTWIATGNNVAVSTEISRRSVPIRMDAKVERPWERTEFRHPALIEWAKENRPALVRAAILLVRNWIANGRVPEQSVRLGGFESWCRTIGGILGTAGIPAFLDNLPEFYDRADVEGQAMSAFVAAWWKKFQGQPVGTAELYEVAVGAELDFGRAETEHSRRMRLGWLVRKLRDRQFGPYRVLALGTERGSARWRLEGGPSEEEVF